MTLRLDTFTRDEDLSLLLIYTLLGFRSILLPFDDHDD